MALNVWSRHAVSRRRGRLPGYTATAEVAALNGRLNGWFLRSADSFPVSAPVRSDGSKQLFYPQLMFWPFMAL